MADSTMRVRSRGRGRRAATAVAFVVVFAAYGSGGNNTTWPVGPSTATVTTDGIANQVQGL